MEAYGETEVSKSVLHLLYPNVMIGSLWWECSGTQIYQNPCAKPLLYCLLQYTISFATWVDKL